MRATLHAARGTRISTCDGPVRRQRPLHHVCAISAPLQRSTTGCLAGRHHARPRFCLADDPIGRRPSLAAAIAAAAAADAISPPAAAAAARPHHLHRRRAYPLYAVAALSHSRRHRRGLRRRSPSPAPHWTSPPSPPAAATPDLLIRTCASLPAALLKQTATVCTSPSPCCCRHCPGAERHRVPRRSEGASDSSRVRPGSVRGPGSGVSSARRQLVGSLRSARVPHDYV